jgi:formylglycine-generating enzyme required for sulfatase activity
MARLVVFPLLLVAGLAAGCGKHDAGRLASDQDGAADFPVLQPKSGGELLSLPAGEFLMGDARGRPDEFPHRVYVSAFAIDRFPVTQELYELVMGVNPSKRKEKKNPVERTQWTDAVRFCNRCSELDGLTPCYDPMTWACRFGANGYRLPTEAEWEYACRAGSQSRYCFGDDADELVQYAWFKPHSGGTPRPVGQNRPNRWGLHDMHGNVWQWCHDFYSDAYYKESPHDDPRGPATGEMRVLRGGAWDCPADKCRASFRAKEHPIFSDTCFGADSYGFRRVRSTDNSTAIVAAAKGPDRAGQEKATAKSEPGPLQVPSSGMIEVARLKGTIVFVSDRGGTVKIWRMHASGRELNQLTTDANPDADPRFSPDGKRVLYTTLRGGFPEVWMMNRDGTGQHFVTKGCQGNWSPDSKAIVFVQDKQAYVCDLASGKERRVTPESWERCGVPAWSPDGKRLAVASRHLGTIGIFILSLDGKDNHQLQAKEPCCTPQWSADGRTILCQTVQGHIHRVGVDGKDWEQLTFGADVQHDARYSPDGSMILFCRAPSPEGPWQLCVKKLDGDDEDFVTLTKEGSNSLPDWHATE